MKRALKFIVSVGAVAGLGALSLTACGNDPGEYVPPEMKSVTVVYHANGGSSSSVDLSADGTYEQTVYETAFDGFSPVKLERDTWLFDGWYTDSAMTVEFGGLSVDRTTVDLYAKWTDEITVTPDNFTDYFTVKSKWNGVATIPGAAIGFSFEPKYIIDPVKTEAKIEIEATPVLSTWRGETYIVELDESGDFTYSRSSRIDEAVQFYIGETTLEYEVKTESAKLTLLHKDPIDVVLDLDGGKLDADTVAVPGGDVIERADLPVPTKPGYRFIDWYADPERVELFSKATVTREITVYAKWAKEAVISFDTCGGSDKAPLTFLLGEKLELGDAPTRDGYGFFGWYTDAECKTPFTDTVAAESTTLYAKWEVYRTVSFDTHGGSEKAAIKVLNTSTLADGELGAAPEKDSLRFDGWFVDAEYKTRYNGEPVTDDITLHARWCVAYNGLQNNLTEEKMRFFFDYGVTLERKTEGSSTVLVSHVTIELKDEFKDLVFSCIFNVTGNYIDADGTKRGNFAQRITISASNGGKVEFDAQTSASGSVNADHVELVFHGNWSNVYLPEDLEVPDFDLI